MKELQLESAHSQGQNLCTQTETSLCTKMFELKHNRCSSDDHENRRKEKKTGKSNNLPLHSTPAAILLVLKLNGKTLYFCVE